MSELEVREIKEKGNKLFQSKDCLAAVEQYNIAIETGKEIISRFLESNLFLDKNMHSKNIMNRCSKEEIQNTECEDYKTKNGRKEEHSDFDGNEKKEIMETEFKNFNKDNIVELQINNNDENDNYKNYNKNDINDDEKIKETNNYEENNKNKCCIGKTIVNKDHEEDVYNKPIYEKIEEHNNNKSDNQDIKTNNNVKYTETEFKYENNKVIKEELMNIDKEEMKRKVENELNKENEELKTKSSEEGKTGENKDFANNKTNQINNFKNLEGNEESENRANKLFFKYNNNGEFEGKKNKTSREGNINITVVQSNASSQAEVIADCNKEEFLSKIEREIGICYYNCAVIFYKERRFEECLEACKKSLEYAELEQARLKVTLVYFKLGLYKKGLKESKTVKMTNLELKNILKFENSNRVKEILSNRLSCCVFDSEYYEEGNLTINQNLLRNIIKDVLCGRIIQSKFVMLVLQEGTFMLSNLENISVVNVKQNEECFVFGDTHGQFFDTFSMLMKIEGNYFDPKKGFFIDQSKKFVFNGDFVDRGALGVENFIFLLLLKILYPQNIILNRGNHEFISLNLTFGFADEIKKKYLLYSDMLLDAFSNTFSMLPIASVINKDVFVVHGGLPDKRCTLDLIYSLDRKTTDRQSNTYFECLMWSDPGEITEHSKPSYRGTGVIYSEKVTADFLCDNGLSLMVRSHECVENGFRSNHGGKCLTIFSSPNYCGVQGRAAYLVFRNGDMPSKMSYDVVEVESWRAENAELKILCDSLTLN